MLFFVRFDVHQPASVSNEDLIETWKREATAALGALPIIREMGGGVTTTALPIYDYATFAGDLEGGVHGP